MTAADQVHRQAARLELAALVELERLIAEAETTPQTKIWYHTVAWKHPDSYPLEILAGIMSEKTGRLYKKLVEEQSSIATGEANLQATLDKVKAQDPPSEITIMICPSEIT